MELTKEEKTKAVKQCKLQFNGVFEPFKAYGLQEYIPGAIEQSIELALLLHKRLNGQDIPVTLEHANGKLYERHHK